MFIAKHTKSSCSEYYKNYRCNYVILDLLSPTTGQSFGDLRLVGSSTGGRLEIYRNSEFGPICNTGLTFGQDEADVACRQLGYIGAEAYGRVDDLG